MQLMANRELVAEHAAQRNVILSHQRSWRELKLHSDGVEIITGTVTVSTAFGTSYLAKSMMQ